jgi:hypothetical protein
MTSKLAPVLKFIWPSASGRNTAVENFDKYGYNVLHWDREGFAFWAVSDVNAEDLELLSIWNSAVLTPPAKRARMRLFP